MDVVHKEYLLGNVIWKERYSCLGKDGEISYPLVRVGVMEAWPHQTPLTLITGANEAWQQIDLLREYHQYIELLVRYYHGIILANLILSKANVYSFKVDNGSSKPTCLHAERP